MMFHSREYTLTFLPVTPLDVVRVRLQAQHTTADSVSSTINTSSPLAPGTPLRAQKLPLSPLQFQSTFARLPPQLGVTACCREVFWMNNQSELCVASTSAISPVPSSSSTAFAESCAIEETSRRKFTGTWEGLVKIARYEGASSLWRGLSPTLLMAIPANVIYFTGYDSLRTSPLSPFSGFSSTWAPLLAGSTARTIAATAISPLELFRTRLWASTTATRGNSVSGEMGAFQETLYGLVSMVKQEGWTSLWRGLTLTLWRDAPFSGIYWVGYETVKGILNKQREKHHNFGHFGHFHSSTSRQNTTAKQRQSDATFTDSFIAGALSGSVAAFLTTPFDVGKTRIQVTQVQQSSSPTSGPIKAGFGPVPNGIYKSMPSFLYGIFKQEGLRGMWRGCIPRTLKVAPACAIMVSHRSTHIYLSLLVVLTRVIDFKL